LKTAEPYNDGPYANVVYKDNAIPWAEFIFTYKSMGIVSKFLSDFQIYWKH